MGRLDMDDTSGQSLAFWVGAGVGGGLVGPGGVQHAADGRG